MGGGETLGTIAIEGTIEDVGLDHVQVPAGATEGDTVREIGIEMSIDAEILAGLPRKEASTILEDIDMTYHQDEPIHWTPSVCLSSPRPLCFALFFPQPCLARPSLLDTPTFIRLL